MVNSDCARGFAETDGSGASPAIAASKVSRETPAACADGHRPCKNASNVSALALPPASQRAATARTDAPSI